MGAFFDAQRSKLLRELKENRIISEHDSVLVAFSGGEDSVVLLLLLWSIKEDMDISVSAMHVNHGIRGEEAKRDEDFCYAFCKEKGIPFSSVCIDVPKEAEKTREGLEECARRLRYKELENRAKELGCNKIATAHHADDNVETVLMHMVRGCGMNGLKGIPRVRGKIIRPIIGFSKKEIKDILSDLGQGFVYDSTNSNTEMTRNLIRHTVLPTLYKLNPELASAFRRMCDTVSEDSSFIDKCASKIPRNEKLTSLAELDRAVLSRYIRARYSEFFANGDCPELDRDAVTEIIDVIKNYEGATKRMLSGGVTVSISFDGIAFLKECSNVKEDYEMPLYVGENIISPYGYRILITCDKKVAIEWQNIYKLSTLTSVNSDRIIDAGRISLLARNRRAGDKYRFGGHTRDVRRQMINFKIPEYKRRCLPCLTDAAGNIVWVPGLPASDDFKPTKSLNTVYIVFADENKYM